MYRFFQSTFCSGRALYESCFILRQKFASRGFWASPCLSLPPIWEAPASALVKAPRTSPWGWGANSKTGLCCVQPGEEGYACFYSLLRCCSPQITKHVYSRQPYAWFISQNSELLECQELKSHWAVRNTGLIHKRSIWKTALESYAELIYAVSLPRSVFPPTLYWPNFSSSSDLNTNVTLSEIPPWPWCLSQVTQSMLPQRILLFSFTALITMINYADWYVHWFTIGLAGDWKLCGCLWIHPGRPAHRPQRWHSEDSDCLLKE